MAIQPHLNKLSKDKFIFVLTVPNLLRELNNRTTRKDELFNLDSMQFSLYDFTIPAIRVKQVEEKFAGQVVNISSHDRDAYTPLTLNFEVDNEYKNYWVIWKWLQLLQDPIDGHYASTGVFPNGKPELIPSRAIEYTTTMYAYVLDEYNNKKVKVTYKRAMPIELGELQFSYRDADKLTSSFTIVYDQIDLELLPIGGE